MTTLVALSAAYGAGGSRIGPALAERLGVPFVDRAIPLDVAGRIDEEAGGDERQGSLFERLLGGFIGMDAGAPTPAASAEDFRRETESELLHKTASEAGVVLGRAAVVVFRHDPHVLRARLTGPPERRTRQAALLAGIDEDEAERRRRRLDHAHAEYLQRFYGAEIDDPTLYHITLDTTLLTPELAVDLLEQAYRAL